MTRPAVIGVVAFAFISALFAWHMATTAPAAHAAPPASSIPVTAGIATARDVPVYVSSVATVQAYDTVTVRTRVDGQITKVLFKQGQEVKAGAPLFQIDPRPFQAALELAQADKQKDEAQLAGAEGDLARYAKLVGPGYQTRQAYEDEKATVAELRAAVQADQAQIDSAQLNLTYADVRSPIDGRTGARLVDLGNFVQAAQATSLVTITQIKPIFVDFTAPQAEFDAIHENQEKAPLAIRVYSGGDKTMLATGQLTLINNQIDTTTGTIELKGLCQNQDERLWPGEFVNVRLILSIRKGAITVPAQAATEGPNGYYVYVIKPDNTVERRGVKVSAIQDGLAVIDSGLSAGEHVVVKGQYRLTNGAKVHIYTPQQSS